MLIWEVFLAKNSCYTVPICGGALLNMPACVVHAKELPHLTGAPNLKSWGLKSGNWVLQHDFSITVSH